MPIVALDFFYNMAAPYKWSMTLLVAFTHALGLISIVMPLEVCALNSGTYGQCAAKHFIAYIVLGWMTHMASTAATVLIVRRQYWRLKACIRDASTFTLIGAAGIYTIAPFCYPILWPIYYALSSQKFSEFIHAMHMIVDVFAVSPPDCHHRDLFSIFDAWLPHPSTSILSVVIKVTDQKSESTIDC
jgi:hypothetical protein